MENPIPNVDSMQGTPQIPAVPERSPERPAPPSGHPSDPGSRSAPKWRWPLAVGAVVVALVAAVTMLWDRSPPPEEVRGTPAWAARHYGNPDRPGFKRRNIVEIEFLGRRMFVHHGASRHFLRLAALFEARAPEYAAAVAFGELDDWSYENRNVRGENSKSNHAFGIAVDVNALANPLGTTGDMPEEVVRQWQVEGGEWGGDWGRPDPMHFETHLTPEEIQARYRADGTPRDWYLEELVEG